MIVALLVSLSSSAWAQCALGAAAFPVTTTMKEPGLPSTLMTMAFDGSRYVSSSGGSAAGKRTASVPVGGKPKLASPGRDLRSISTLVDGAGPLYFRSYASPLIEEYVPGAGLTKLVTLTGGTLDAQSSVVVDPLDSDFVAQINGLVCEWDTTGALRLCSSLVGYGTMGSEGGSPQNRGIAMASNGCRLTYADGVISTWDVAGNRISTATLTGAPVTFDAYYSFSYADGQVFMADAPGGKWYGYDIGI